MKLASVVRGSPKGAVQSDRLLLADLDRRLDLYLSRCTSLSRMGAENYYAGSPGQSELAPNPAAKVITSERWRPGALQTAAFERLLHLQPIRQRVVVCEIAQRKPTRALSRCDQDPPHRENPLGDQRLEIWKLELWRRHTALHLSKGLAQGVPRQGRS